jgi:hypothetical protein
MKNIISKGIFAGCAVSLLIACNDTKKEPAATVDKEQIKIEIQAREDEFAKMYNAGEMKSIGYYSDDAISFLQNRHLSGEATLII